MRSTHAPFILAAGTGFVLCSLGSARCVAAAVQAARSPDMTRRATPAASPSRLHPMLWSLRSGRGQSSVSETTARIPSPHPPPRVESAVPFPQESDPAGRPRLHRPAKGPNTKPPPSPSRPRWRGPAIRPGLSPTRGCDRVTSPGP
ncbi:hypothetical protein VULLAG_LOCUS23810 [Vulpes lagopus]